MFRIKQIIKSVVGAGVRTIDPYWHRRAVGGLWEEIGKLQFEFLITQGLKPHHFLLDVGCGSLRGGLHFIRYLDPGHYVGVDIDNKLLAKGRWELKRARLLRKKPVLVHMGDFDFLSLNQQFDYALAISVFTHLPLNMIMRCIINISKVLVPGGHFFATFFENPAGLQNLEPILHPRVDGPPIASFFDQDPYHYDFETFKWICERCALECKYIGDWGHPRDQKMLRIIKPE